MSGAVAIVDTVLISVPRDTMSAVVKRNPRLARNLGETIEIRRSSAAHAIAEAAQGVR
jgi:CRP-like cAMP-binding protein